MLQPIQIHQQPDWPTLRWAPEVANILATVRHRQGRLLGRMETLGFDLQQETGVNTLTDDVVATSAIEGEILDPTAVRSSVAHRLGIGPATPPTPAVDGIVAVNSDATQNYAAPLTANRLFNWHNSLFPSGRSNLQEITAGAWRPPGSDPIQVVSGPFGRERVHFQAPDAHRVPAEMDAVLEWFNAPTDTDWVLRSGLAHLWFVTIHPSMTATDASPAPSPTWHSPGRSKHPRGPTACLTKYAKTAPTTTASSNRPRRAAPTSLHG